MSQEYIRQKPRNVLFTGSMFKSLRMNKFSKNLNGGIVHLKPFPESKTGQMDHHTITNLEGHQCDAAAIHIAVE